MVDRCRPAARSGASRAGSARVCRWPAPGSAACAAALCLLTSRPSLAAPAAGRTAAADDQTPAPSFLSDVNSLKFEVGAIFTVLSVTGFMDWKWGTASFRFNPEGWFGMHTGSGGQDKVGHGFSSYLMTEFFYLRLRDHYGLSRPASLVPPVASFVLMNYVEMFDGFSVDHGYSYEDLTTDSIGITLSFARALYPPLRDVIDFRMEYFPSPGVDGWHALTDYSGQKFLLALKGAGLSMHNRSPLRYTELLVGYYTRGFMDTDAPYYPEKVRRLFVGVGLNLEYTARDLLGIPDGYPGSTIDWAVSPTRYFQIAGSHPEAVVHERRAPP